MLERPSWDSYWLGQAESVATRSTCSRRRVGAVIVRDNRMLSQGYNGAPRGIKHCDHPPDWPSACRISEHAERNAVTFAECSLSGATVYVTDSPCFDCAKTLINARVLSVVFRRPYRLREGLELLDEAGVLWRVE